MKPKNEVIVYWASVNESDAEKWDILFHQPDNLLDELFEQRDKNNSNNFLRCPANKQFIKNIFVMRNLLETKYEIKETEFIPKGSSFLGIEKPHLPTLKNQPLIELPLDTIFFTEEKDLEMSLTSPFFHYAPHTQFASLVPGRFNINKWFRTMNLEFNVWASSKKFEIGHLEPIAYFNFHTDKNVKLVRFNFTPTLRKIDRVISNSSIWEKMKTLDWRYARFDKSGIRKMIMSEISKNLLD